MYQVRLASATVSSVGSHRTARLPMDVDARGWLRRAMAAAAELRRRLLFGAGAVRDPDRPVIPPGPRPALRAGQPLVGFGSGLRPGEEMGLGVTRWIDQACDM